MFPITQTTPGREQWLSISANGNVIQVYYQSIDQQKYSTVKFLNYMQVTYMNCFTCRVNILQNLSINGQPVFPPTSQLAAHNKQGLSSSLHFLALTTDQRDLPNPTILFGTFISIVIICVSPNCAPTLERNNRLPHHSKFKTHVYWLAASGIYTTRL